VYDTRDAAASPPGPHHPVAGTPPRAPGSIRRTTTADISFPHGIGYSVTADVRGQDVHTTAAGHAEVTDAFAVTFTIDPGTTTIVAVDIAAANESLDALVGLPMRGGFAKRLMELLPGDSASRSLRYSAIENVGGAYLVSGYAGLRTGTKAMTPEHAQLAAEMQADVCIGWAADGPVIETIKSTGQNAVPFGPAAPTLEGDDPLGWHEQARLAPTSVRRRRRTDVSAATDGHGLQVEHHFRDSYADIDTEQVMHEYLVHARFDDQRRVAELRVDPRVLPWRECPGAVASAQHIVGVALDEIAAEVHNQLTGVTTCTHLNSTLRALADVRTLGLILTG
jgi:hypothetical protein